MADKELVCADCGQSFIWSEAEQEFFASRSFDAPKRCLDCRGKRRRGEVPIKPVGKTIICIECGQEFVFSEKESGTFIEEPKRCYSCRREPPGKKLNCAICGLDFIFTEREQEFFRSNGFEEPKRCLNCRRDWGKMSVSQIRFLNK